MTSNITLVEVQQKAPIEVISKESIQLAVNRMKVIVPHIKSLENLTQVAQESILYRTVPGRDMHYWEDWQGNLQRTPDYKYLKNFTTFKEQQLSGDDNASLDDSYRTLTADEKEQHGIPDKCIAAQCTITTKREREQFRLEVKQWIDTGFSPGQAVEIVEKTYGNLGTSAVGVVDPTEIDKKGKPITPPSHWSYLQWAEKLAFKNAVNRKYGIPTADEMAALSYRMAKKAMPEHWQNVDATLPREDQAKQANYEAITSSIIEQHQQMTPEEKNARKEKNVIIMRGEPEYGIGEDYKENNFDLFIDNVLSNVSFYQTGNQIEAAMTTLELVYDPENEDHIFDCLARYAGQPADGIASQDETPF